MREVELGSVLVMQSTPLWYGNPNGTQILSLPHVRKFDSKYVICDGSGEVVSNVMNRKVSNLSLRISVDGQITIISNEMDVASYTVNYDKEAFATPLNMFHGMKPLYGNLLSSDADRWLSNYLGGNADGYFLASVSHGIPHRGELIVMTATAMMQLSSMMDSKTMEIYQGIGAGTFFPHILLDMQDDMDLIVAPHITIGGVEMENRGLVTFNDSRTYVNVLHGAEDHPLNLGTYFAPIERHKNMSIPSGAVAIIPR